jgi:hypothetical protein
MERPPDLPERLVGFFKWMDEDHSTADVMQRIYEYLGDITREIEKLQHERRAIESLLGYMADHHIPEHQGEPVQVRNFRYVAPEERSSRILELAQELVKEGNTTISPSDVERKLDEHHEDLNVTYPTSVIGNVLARSRMFTRMGRNRYYYAGQTRSLSQESP